MPKRLAVIFGGVTTEHEVSVITGVQLLNRADPEKYSLVPIYIDKSGRWWTGTDLLEIAYYRNQDLHAPIGLKPFEIHPVPDSNDIDVAILCFHGGYGESGKIQGLLDLAEIPYQGPGVLGSAIAFDKIVSRQILTAEGINQPPYVWFTDRDWHQNPQLVLERLEQLEYPLFVKPSRSGSSIGIQKVDQPTELEQTIIEVLQFDSRILVEAGITNCIEVNVSVLGDEEEAQASITEQPISADEFLSYADKYEKGGGKKQGMASANRRIPAPISSNLSKKLQALAVRIFHLFDCSGVVRIDFFVNPSIEEIFVIELNTIPGSMSFYLWEATDLPYADLIDRLVIIAQKQQQRHQQLIRSFDSNILQNEL